MSLLRQRTRLKPFYTLIAFQTSRSKLSGGAKTRGWRQQTDARRRDLTRCPWTQQLRLDQSIIRECNSKTNKAPSASLGATASALRLGARGKTIAGHSSIGLWSIDLLNVLFSCLRIFSYCFLLGLMMIEGLFVYKII